MAKLIDINKNLLKRLYSIEKKSMSECGRMLCISKDTVRKKLIKYGISVESNRRPRDERLIFSKREKEFIDGCLLGDGHISNYRQWTSSDFRYLAKDMDHTFFIYKNLLKFSTNRYKKGPVKSTIWDKRTKKWYTRYDFRTVSNVAFYDLRNRWYPHGVKELPKDISLTNLVCLLWYVGDGGLLKGQRTQEIKLSTHCFSKKAIESVLLPQLKRFNAHIRNAGNNQFAVIIPNVKIESFLKFIGDCPVKCYEYKWKIFPYKSIKYKHGTNHKTVEKEIVKFIKQYKQGSTYYRIAKNFKVEPALVRYYLIKNNVYKEA